MDNKARVFIKIDENKRVIQIEGEYSLANFSNLTECIFIDEGYGEKYTQAQTCYLEKPIITEDGIYQYKYENGTVRERTEEEIEADRAQIPEPEPTLDVEEKIWNELDTAYREGVDSV